MDSIGVAARVKQLGPHPEELCAARRLEGWMHGTNPLPSFETPAQEDGLLQDEVVIPSPGLEKRRRRRYLRRQNAEPGARTLRTNFANELWRTHHGHSRGCLHP